LRRLRPARPGVPARLRAAPLQRRLHDGRRPRRPARQRVLHDTEERHREHRGRFLLANGTTVQNTVFGAGAPKTNKKQSVGITSPAGGTPSASAGRRSSQRGAANSPRRPPPAALIPANQPLI